MSTKTNFKRVALELGGKSPAIIDRSADISEAAERIVYGKLMNAGQTCVAPDHLWVDRKIAPALLDALRSLFDQHQQDGQVAFGDCADVILAGVAEIRPLKLMSEHSSADGTVKWLFDVGGGDGVKRIVRALGQRSIVRVDRADFEDARRRTSVAFLFLQASFALSIDAGSPGKAVAAVKDGPWRADGLPCTALLFVALKRALDRKSVV